MTRKLHPSPWANSLFVLPSKLAVVINFRLRPSGTNFDRFFRRILIELLGKYLENIEVLIDWSIKSTGQHFSPATNFYWIVSLVRRTFIRQLTALAKTSQHWSSLIGKNILSNFVAEKTSLSARTIYETNCWGLLPRRVSTYRALLSSPLTATSPILRSRC